MATEHVSRRTFLGLFGGAAVTGLGAWGIARAAGDPNITVTPGCADGRFTGREEDGDGPFQSLRIETAPDLDTSSGTITELSQIKNSTIPDNGTKMVTQRVRVTDPGEQLFPMQIVSYPQSNPNVPHFGEVPQIRPNGKNEVTIYKREGIRPFENGDILAHAEVVSPPCPPPPNPLTPSPR